MVARHLEAEGCFQRVPTSSTDFSFCPALTCSASSASAYSAASLSSGSSSAPAHFACHGALAHYDTALRATLTGKQSLYSISVGCRVKERCITVWPKDVGEELWQDTAKHQVGICDGCMPSLPVAYRPWVCPCRLRSHLSHEGSPISLLPPTKLCKRVVHHCAIPSEVVERCSPAVVAAHLKDPSPEKEARASPSSHCIDVQLWCLNGHTCTATLSERGMHGQGAGLSSITLHVTTSHAASPAMPGERHQESPAVVLSKTCS